MLLLLAGAGIAAALGEWAEAIAILAALLLNAAIGFLAEWRARVSLARLRALAVPHAIVRRDGQLARIAAEELVPGDVVVLEAGAAVPADARLLRSAALQVDESALTGESAAVWKDAAARPAARRPARGAGERGASGHRGALRERARPRHRHRPRDRAGADRPARGLDRPPGHAARAPGGSARAVD